MIVKEVKLVLGIVLNGYKYFEYVFLYLFFRLVVVVEKKIVYKEFLILFINCMEKYFLNMEGMLIDY